MTHQILGHWLGTNSLVCHSFSFSKQLDGTFRKRRKVEEPFYVPWISYLWLSCEFLQLDTPIIDSRKCQMTKLGRPSRFACLPGVWWAVSLSKCWSPSSSTQPPSWRRRTWRTWGRRRLRWGWAGPPTWKSGSHTAGWSPSEGQWVGRRMHRW